MRPVRSTLSRRVRGVLSPYRERGIWALARLWIPAYAGMTVRRARCALSAVPSPAAFAASSPLMGEGELGASRQGILGFGLREEGAETLVDLQRLGVDGLEVARVGAGAFVRCVGGERGLFLRFQLAEPPDA